MYSDIVKIAMGHYLALNDPVPETILSPKHKKGGKEFFALFPPFRFPILAVS